MLKKYTHSKSDASGLLSYQGITSIDLFSNSSSLLVSAVGAAAVSPSKHFFGQVD